ncbi:DUF3613 domain-containing protein [Pseudomonas aeruginosa]|nr:DUF3613 domain-containing protein [Pseudomonas aeruginosa]
MGGADSGQHNGLQRWRASPEGHSRDRFPLRTPAEPQTATRAWLAIQASGRAASPVRQSATAAERQRAYQRYLKSYEHEIPEYLLEDRGFGESKN